MVVASSTTAEVLSTTAEVLSSSSDSLEVEDVSLFVSLDVFADVLAEEGKS